MAAAGPFEPRPHLAVAVSGGADSMALAFLARDWVEPKGGAVTALTVDHRLRPGSAREARWVHEALRARGIAHRTLVWREGAGAGRANLQAGAREARYRLLEAWCRSAGVLHLLTAHHLADQAETFLIRLGRGSGLFGLAAMAPVAERHGLRLIRPLLGMAPDTLRAALRGAGQDWVEDPSNADPAFARVRMRRALGELEAAGIDAGRIAATAARLGRDRAALERRVAVLLARAASPHPAGFVRLDHERFKEAPAEVGLRALSRVLSAVGGSPYGPRFVRLERLYAEIRGPCRPRTLGGCAVRKARGASLLVCREPAAQAAPVAVFRPGVLRWDGRFHVRLSAVGGAAKGAGMTLGPLGAEDWARIKADAGGFDMARARARLDLPATVRAGLPALRDAAGVTEVPHLGYRRSRGGTGSLRVIELWPLPPEPMAGPAFRAVAAGDRGDTAVGKGL
jgi:tRNA(Ile)-lysidine synthase